jgi:hypothetical protein
MKFSGFSAWVTDVTLATWLVEDGDYIEKNQVIAEILVEWTENEEQLRNTYKQTAEESGVIKLKAAEGSLVRLDCDIVCSIDISAKKPKYKPLKYFLPEISPYSPIKAKCPSCDTETTYSSHMRINTSERNHYLYTYQCQSCGKLESSEEAHPNGIRVGLESRCVCGGQFRRDKNIFCPCCKYRRTADNKAEDRLYATSEEMVSLIVSHGNEEIE